MSVSVWVIMLSFEPPADPPRDGQRTEALPARRRPRGQ